MANNANNVAIEMVAEADMSREAVRKETQELETAIDNLAPQAAMQRITVSEASNDLFNFITANEKEDPLVHQEQNTWRDQRTGIFAYIARLLGWEDPTVQNNQRKNDQRNNGQAQ